jgi:2-polyprenyl-3-methyl-5-hydroxy-6-metoxy-1,4-benzoquinol methylase
MFNHNICPLCKSTNLKFEISCSDYLTNIEGLWSYYKCESCDYIFLNPELSLEEFKSLYNSSTHKLHYHQDSIPPEKKDFISQIKNFLKNICYRYTMNNFAKKNKSLFLFGKIFEKKMRIALTPENTNAESSILEIGSGNGERLRSLKNLGYKNIYANEFNEKLAKKLEVEYDITVWTKDIREIEETKNKKFDFIVSSMTLEHISNPSSFVNYIHEILQTDGIFCFSVPNYDCLETKIFGETTFGLQPPYHVSQFTEKSLQYLLKNFKTVNFYYQFTDRDWVSSARRVFNKKPTLRNNILNIGRFPFLRKTILKLFLISIYPFRKTGRVTVYAKK